MGELRKLARAEAEAEEAGEHITVPGANRAKPAEVVKGKLRGDSAIEQRLRLEAEVHNPDTVELPFGLGYHPYFRLPFAGTDKADDYGIEVPAAE